MQARLIERCDLREAQIAVLGGVRRFYEERDVACAAGVFK